MEMLGGGVISGGRMQTDKEVGDPFILKNLVDKF
jgi:hypothetical protein